MIKSQLTKMLISRIKGGGPGCFQNRCLTSSLNKWCATHGNHAPEETMPRKDAKRITKRRPKNSLKNGKSLELPVPGVAAWLRWS